MSTDIPKIIHVYWDGPTISEEFVSYIDRWQELHPAWTLIRWNHNRYVEAFSKAAQTMEYYLHPERWSPSSNVWQWRSDLARYEILNSLGGVWVDCDLEPLKPIDELLDLPHSGTIIARESSQWINNAFMACAPGCPFITDVRSGLDVRVRHGVRKRVNHSIGARYITQVVKNHPGIQILPRELIYPFRWDELHRRNDHFPGAYTKHHWNNMTAARNKKDSGRSKV